MFCPNCSEQKANDATQFCKRCGLDLFGLSEFVESGAGDVRKPNPSWKSQKRHQAGRYAFFHRADADPSLDVRRSRPSTRRPSSRERTEHHTVRSDRVDRDVGGVHRRHVARRIRVAIRRQKPGGI